MCSLCSSHKVVKQLNLNRSEFHCDDMRKNFFSACSSSLYDIERSEKKKDSRLRLFIARLLFLDSKNWIEIILVYVYILPKQWCFLQLITINSTTERKNEWKWIRRIFYVPKLWLKLGHIITFEKIWSIIC